MRALLDTHSFLLWNAGDPKLSKAAHEFISEGRNEVFLSAASAWEIAVKYARGRLILPEPPEKYVPERLLTQNFTSLPIQVSHALHVASLPDIHQDPFDRLLVAQSQLESLPLLTSDGVFSRYGVEVIW